MSVKRKRKDPVSVTSAESDEAEQVAPVAGGAAEALGAAPVAGGIDAAAEARAGSPAPAEPGRDRGGEAAAEEGHPASTASDELVRTLGARVIELEGQLADLKDQLLRKAADFDNFRKRMARDKEESIRFANSALLADLLEVIDGFERAIASSETSRDFGALHQGVALIEKQLLDTLDRKWGLRRMSTMGTRFDPAFHQAVTVGEPVASGEQVVLEELQSGYLLHDRVVRPARVKVSAPRRSGAGESLAAAGGVPEAAKAGGDAATPGGAGGREEQR